MENSNSRTQKLNDIINEDRIGLKKCRLLYFCNEHFDTKE